MGKRKEPPAFEAALEELESIVQRMEDGALSLEESLQIFERGIILTRRCQKALDEAEQRVEVLDNTTPPSVVGMNTDKDAAEDDTTDD